MTDEEIIKRLREHLDAVSDHFYDYFFLALQGSQNYGLADEESDIDSKILTIPSLNNLVFKLKPQNKVHIMDNDEHCDLKDIREYFRIMRKSNINFVEVLFSRYVLVNPKYQRQWQTLQNFREDIARLNPVRAVKCMKGMASEKLHALRHEYPSRMYWIKKYGFDPKQLSHLSRIHYFVYKYIQGELYENCIYITEDTVRHDLLALKRNTNNLTADEAEELGNAYMNSITQMVDEFCETHENREDEFTSTLLDTVVYDVIEASLREQL